jgi:hypothetical protein
MISFEGGRMRLKTIVPFVVVAILAALPVRGDGPLVNQDVIKMVSAGLGENLVIAKIKEASSVKFVLEVDALVSGLFAFYRP